MTISFPASGPSPCGISFFLALLDSPHLLFLLLTPAVWPGALSISDFLLATQMAAGNWAGVEDAPFLSRAHYPWPPLWAITGNSRKPLAFKNVQARCSWVYASPPYRAATKYTLCLMQIVKGHPIWVEKFTKKFPFSIAPQPLFIPSARWPNAGQICTILYVTLPNSRGHTPGSPKNPLTLMAAQGLPTNCSSSSIQRGSQSPLLKRTSCSVIFLALHFPLTC